MGALEFEGPADAHVLVLSNALGATAEMWRPQMSLFTQHFRVCRYEHPPLASVAELAAELRAQLDHAGLERVSFCGLSVGAMVGMQLAAEFPQRIDRLILACTAARFGQPSDWAAKAAGVRKHGMAQAAAEAIDLWLAPGHPDRERFLRMQLDTPAESYARGLEAIGGFDFRLRLGQIHAPTLVLAGQLDLATTPADGRRLAAGIPGAAFSVIPGAAHIANADAPEHFGSLVMSHLRGAGGRPSAAARCSDPLEHVERPDLAGRPDGAS